MRLQYPHLVSSIEEIAVEIKSFVSNSSVTDCHLAVGQFINYRVALEVSEPDRKLFLAIPNTAYKEFFQKKFPQMVVRKYQLEVLIYDIESQEIISWKI